MNAVVDIGVYVFVVVDDGVVICVGVVVIVHVMNDDVVYDVGVIDIVGMCVCVVVVVDVGYVVAGVVGGTGRLCDYCSLLCCCCCCLIACVVALLQSSV